MADKFEQMVEKSARDLYAHRFPDANVTEHFDWFKHGKDRADSCVHYSNVAFAIDDVRVVLTALALGPDKVIVPREPVAWRFKWAPQNNWYLTTDRDWIESAKLHAVEPLYAAAAQEKPHG